MPTTSILQLQQIIYHVSCKTDAVILGRKPQCHKRFANLAWRFWASRQNRYKTGLHRARGTKLCMMRHILWKIAWLQDGKGHTWGIHETETATGKCELLLLAEQLILCVSWTSAWHRHWLAESRPSWNSVEVAKARFFAPTCAMACVHYSELGTSGIFHLPPCCFHQPSPSCPLRPWVIRC